MPKLVLAVLKFIAITIHLSYGDNIQSNDLINGIPKCSLSSPKQELNDCLKEVFAYLTPRLKDGVPELQIPAMDPLTIDKAKYQLKRNDFQLRVVVKNVMITGLVGSITKDVDFHLDGDKIFLKTNSFVARVNTTGLYKAEMVFSNTPRYYEGTFDVAIMDLDCLNEFEGEIMEKCYCGCQECECDCSSEKAEKKKVVQLVKYNVVPTVGNMNIKATGLNPDPAINSIMLQMANDYWQQFYKYVIPETKKYWEPLMIHISNKFISAISFDSVFY